MPASRAEMLLEFIRQRPDDPFPRYALAIEYKNGGHLAEARQAFAELMAAKPDYTASYLHAGNVLLALGQPEEARRVYASGIAACQKVGDAHAGGELQAALAALPASGA